MPFVNIKITKEGATPEQKAELIKGVTDLLVKVLHKNPRTTVVIDRRSGNRQLGDRGRDGNRHPEKGYVIALHPAR